MTSALPAFSTTSAGLDSEHQHRLQYQRGNFQLAPDVEAGAPLDTIHGDFMGFFLVDL